MDAHLPTGSAPHDWEPDRARAALERDFNARVDIAGWLVLDPQMEESALRDRASRRCSRVMRKKWRASASRSCATSSVTWCCGCSTSTGAITWRRWITPPGHPSARLCQKDYRYEYSAKPLSCSPRSRRVKYEVASMLAKIEVRTQEQIDREEQERRETPDARLQASTPNCRARSPTGRGAVGLWCAASMGAPAAARAMAPSRDAVRAW